MRFVFLIFIFFVSSSVFSQVEHGIRFGAFAGLNITNVSFSPPNNEISPQSLSGFRGGISIDPYISTNFSIQPEISYEALNWQYNGPDNNFGGNVADVKSYINYLIISILPKYHINKSGLSVFLGPGYGFLLSAKTKGYQNMEYDVKDFYNSGDFTGIFGLDYELSFGLGFDARYVLGLSDISNSSSNGTSIHNHAISFSCFIELSRIKLLPEI